MANAGGGVIVIGAMTKRTGEHEEIRRINGCRLADVSPRRYRDLVRMRVYPLVEAFAVEPIGGPVTGEGVVLLTVPTQDAGQNPFLVTGALIADRVLGAFVSVPRRVGDETSALDPPTLHARLRAGERSLARKDDSDLRVMRRELEHARDASAPVWLRRTIAAARRDGIVVDYGRGFVGFSRPGAAPVVVSTDEQGPLVDELHRQRLVEQLAELGLRVGLGPRGQLIPVDAE
jgi:hypothetical protein